MRVRREQCSYTVKSISAKKASNKSDLHLLLWPMAASVTNVVVYFQKPCMSPDYSILIWHAILGRCSIA